MQEGTQSLIISLVLTVLACSIAFFFTKPFNQNFDTSHAKQTKMTSDEKRGSGVKHLYITRHGQRIDFIDKEWGERNLEYKHDPPLSETGHLQARELGVHCSTKLNITRIVSSPYIRCLQTAVEVAKEIERQNSGSCVKIVVEPGIQEYPSSLKRWSYHRAPRWYFFNDLSKQSDSGVYEQRIAPILPYIDLDYKPIYSERDYFLRVGTESEEQFIESREELETRLLKVFAHFMHSESEKDDSVLFVTHAAGLISGVEALTEQENRDMRTGVCGITYVTFEDKRYSLIVNNDVSFLSLGEMHHWMYAEPRSTTSK